MYSYALTLYNLFSHLSALENNVDLLCPINEQRTKWNITFAVFIVPFISFWSTCVLLIVSIYAIFWDETKQVWLYLTCLGVFETSSEVLQISEYINIAMTYTLPDFQTTSKTKLNVQQSCFKKCLVKSLSDMSYMLTATSAGTSIKMTQHCTNAGGRS